MVTCTASPLSLLSRLKFLSLPNSFTLPLPEWPRTMWNGGLQSLHNSSSLLLLPLHAVPLFQCQYFPQVAALHSAPERVLHLLQWSSGKFAPAWALHRPLFFQETSTSSGMGSCVGCRVVICSCVVFSISCWDCLLHCSPLHKLQRNHRYVSSGEGAFYNRRRGI